jgi:hypothetical protein
VKNDVSGHILKVVKRSTYEDPVEYESDDDFPLLSFFAIGIVAIIFAYASGYLLIDVAGIVTVTEAAFQFGSIHAARGYVGAIALGVPGAVFVLWGTRKH